MKNEDEIDLADDFQIDHTSKRQNAGGTWISGSLNGYAFQALVFPEHATSESFEYQQSRISKLWVRRIKDKVVVFNFDRGLDIELNDPLAKQVVAFLAECLAEHVFGN